jgi:hypothetical protein
MSLPVSSRFPRLLEIRAQYYGADVDVLHAGLGIARQPFSSEARSPQFEHIKTAALPGWMARAKQPTQTRSFVHWPASSGGVNTRAPGCCRILKHQLHRMLKLIVFVLS